jgi:hypothetical protein
VVDFFQDYIVLLMSYRTGGPVSVLLDNYKYK